MATHIISSNRTVGVDIMADNDKWIVAAGVSMDVSGGDNAFFGSRNIVDAEVDILGSVHTTGVVSSLLLQGNRNTIIVESGGSIDSSRNAISITGRNGHVDNDGSITAVDFGIRMRGPDGLVVNTGTITSDGTGVDFSDVRGELQNSGTISGRIGVAVHADFLGISVENHGTIAGTKYAYVGDDAKETLTNAGMIDGNVYMRNNADVFISNGGTVTGSVFGGNGNDTYNIDSASISLVEIDGGGNDLVFSSVSYKLTAFFENLRLSGTGAIDGTGNNLGNFIRGNGQANHLSGLGGADQMTGMGGNDQIVGGRGRDRLNGGGGADILAGNIGSDRIAGGNGADRITGGVGRDYLIGGAGADTFVFADKHAVDTIADFTARGQRHDILDLSRLTTIDSFFELKQSHLTQDGANAVITDGNGQIILLDVQATQLTSHDFLF